MKLLVLDFDDQWDNSSIDDETLVYRKSTCEFNNIQSALLCDDARSLTQLGMKYKESYAAFIHGLRLVFDSEPLLTKESSPLFYLTDLSCKRSEFFSTFSDLCHLKLLENIINEKKIRSIHFKGITPEFEFAARSSLIISNCICTFEQNTKSKDKYDGFSYLLSQNSYFSRTFIQLIFCKLLFPKQDWKKNELFFTRYPLQLNSSFQEEKYGELSNEKHFLVSVFTDGMHQKVNIIDYINHLLFLKKNHEKLILLDKEVRFTDLLIFWSRSFALYRKAAHILPRSLVFEGIDLRAHLTLEAQFSMLRLPRLMMHKTAFNRVFEKTKAKTIWYYLHEYPWGRLISKLASVYDIYRVGFQHGPSGLLRLNYVLAEGEAGLSVPIPDELLAEDSFSKKLYESYGYRNVKIMKQVYRLSYLNDIKRMDDPLGILIACGLHDAEYLLNSLCDKIRKNPQEKFFLRLHPRSNQTIPPNVKKLNLPNLFLAEGPISYWLSASKEVWYSYSSVGLEARLLGIPTREVWPRDRVFEYMQENQNE